jgi:DHA1 family bicyclomycin/chloramphenicol resistance-like MFS transporter
MLAASLLVLLPSATRWGGAIGLMLPIVAYILGLGLVLPNALAAAMEPLPHMAGNTASLLGEIQMALGSLAGFLVNLLFDHTPVPMGLFLAGTSVIAVAVYAATVRGAKAA